MDDNKNTATKYDSKKVVRMIILGSAITIFIMTIILSFNDFEGIVEVLKTTNVKYLMLAILLLLIYAILYPITLCILTKTRKCKISMLNTYLIGSTEHFFNGITPFATGGQPFQVYAYNRLGVKPADSTGILMMNFIVHMIAVNIFSLASLFYYPMLAQSVQNLLPMVIIGFAISFVILPTVIFSIATSKRVRVWIEKALIWLCRFKWLKKFIEPNIPRVNEYCYQAQTAFKELLKHKGSFIACLLVRLITMGVYYAITFFILKALNIQVGADKLFFIICSTSFAITMSAFIPTPGSSGGIEFAFKSIFQAAAVGITAEVAMGGMLLWRLLSYYLMMLLSFFIYLALEKITLNREKEIMNILPRIKKKTGIGKNGEETSEVLDDENTVESISQDIESIENDELTIDISNENLGNEKTDESVASENQEPVDDRAGSERLYIEALENEVEKKND